MRIFFALVFPFLAFATERFEWQRPDGSNLIGYSDRPKKKPFSTVLLIQGSQKESVERFHNALKDPLLKMGMGLISLEKREYDSPKYHQFNSVDQRFADYSLLLEKARGEWGIEKWVFLGQSEGGRIAALLAKKQPGLQALVLVCPGGAWEVEAELFHSLRKGFGSPPPGYLHSFVVKTKQEFEEIKEKPTPDLQSYGFTHRYWAALFQTHLASDLAAVTCPIYFIHAKNHDWIPLESVKDLEQALSSKKVLSFEIRDRGMDLLQARETYLEAFQWLQKTVR